MFFVLSCTDLYAKLILVYQYTCIHTLSDIKHFVNLVIYNRFGGRGKREHLIQIILFLLLLLQILLYLKS